MRHKEEQVNRIALVTGASKGLGAAIAARLADTGLAVAVNYHRDRSGAEAVVKQIRKAEGMAEAFQADVTDVDGVKALIEAVSLRMGAPTVLVNNATGPQPFIPIERQEWRDYQAQLDFFLKAPLLLVQRVLPYMKSAGFGRVINIGSEVVELGNAEFSHYVAAKAAMLGITRSWANELGQYGITVNLVAPGWIPVKRHEGTPQSELDAYGAGLPLNRMGKPDEVGDAVAFLASERSGFITGQRIAVNGGKTLS
ncbi:SDR family oxidoreductase [Parapedobacter indicus]|uniref:3-oxoacyl-[acyl-carrier protein] reductase n=1 Tax=Parapedobacter indicus TaxID=1477437 RepID=A0A1I3G167_9SPHI|nr:SDR family oxidoreductase [Parapedobacter indicus]PPL03983.1 3-oxoacyl-[acyl-carrier protein] reductase [Parapedobacter indicus]SFI17213.1 3-oxoacyl-[acyl-carrier protein] reductase [Parapedobacter indicus]